MLIFFNHANILLFDIRSPPPTVYINSHSQCAHVHALFTVFERREKNLHPHAKKRWKWVYKHERCIFRKTIFTLFICFANQSCNLCNFCFSLAQRLGLCGCLISILFFISAYWNKTIVHSPLFTINYSIGIIDTERYWNATFEDNQWK